MLVKRTDVRRAAKVGHHQVAPADLVLRACPAMPEVVRGIVVNQVIRLAVQSPQILDARPDIEAPLLVRPVPLQQVQGVNLGGEGHQDFPCGDQFLAEVLEAVHGVHGFDQGDLLGQGPYPFFLG